MKRERAGHLMFELSKQEFADLRCQFCTSKQGRGGREDTAIRFYGAGRRNAFERTAK